MLDPIHNVITTLSDFLYQPFIVPFLLVAAGLYLSIRMGFPQIRLFIETLRVLNEKPVQGSGISSFGALMVSTASRVGTGNIVGVSSAICMGGLGAVFWMWLIAVIGSASAFVESTLAQIYKREDLVTGHSYGGPSYYIQTALGQRWLGIIFSVFILLTYLVGYNLLASYNVQTSFSGYSSSAALQGAASCTVSSAAFIQTKPVWVPHPTLPPAQAFRTRSSRVWCSRFPCLSTRS